MKCIKYKSINRGALLGYATIYVEKWGIEIQGFAYMQNLETNARWLGFPGKKFVGASGENKFQPFFRFREKAHYDAFCVEVTKCIKEYLENEFVQETQSSEELFSVNNTDYSKEGSFF